MEKTRDVLVAFVDAIPQVRRGLFLQEIEHRRRLAVTGRRSDPADAVAKRVVDGFHGARPADDLSRPRGSASCSGSRSHAFARGRGPRTYHTRYEANSRVNSTAD